MPKRITGRYDPPILLDTALIERIRIAEQALVRLELAGKMVPSLDWLIATDPRVAPLPNLAAVLRRRGRLVL